MVDTSIQPFGRDSARSPRKIGSQAPVCVGPSATDVRQSPSSTSQRWGLYEAVVLATSCSSTSTRLALQLSNSNLGVKMAETNLGSADLAALAYLGTNALLDLLATVEEGFSLVERVATSRASGSSKEEGVSSDFGAQGNSRTTCP